MRKLEILIPQYKETDNDLKPMLDSIAIQQNVNFDEIGVIICNDGTDVRLTDDFLHSYPFEIIYDTTQEHRGVSATRNHCLDLATAELIMFCDADDMFYNVNGIWFIFDRYKQQPFNTLTSVFMEEGRHPETGDVMYLPHEFNTVFVHGCVYRRRYLTENKIRFNEDLKIHEDSYFTLLAQRLGDPAKALYCPIPFYLWRWAENSVCRHDKLYILKTMPDMLKSTTALIKEFMRRGHINDSQMYAMSSIIDGYYTLNSDEWLAVENEVYRDRVERNYAWFYNEFQFLIDNCPQDMKAQIVAGIKQRSTMQGVLFEKITFDEWIAHIKTLRPEPPQSYNDEMGIGSITDEDKDAARDILKEKEAAI